METVITIEELETTLPLSNFQESINNALRKPASATVPSQTSQSPTKQGRRRRPTYCVGERKKDDLPGKVYCQAAELNRPVKQPVVRVRETESKQ